MFGMREEVGRKTALTTAIGRNTLGSALVVAPALLLALALLLAQALILAPARVIEGAKSNDFSGPFHLLAEVR
jgi:hypothetical protein